ncbi:MAG: hypothetical protein GY774_16375 [Planctomycetes bacterium]|nr:hypothetical protein [Planctomycetota bacterium]
MYQVRMVLEGVAPLRMNKFDPACLSGPTGAKLDREQKIKQAKEKKPYKDDKLGFFVPGNAIKKCIVNGGKRVKSGRRAASTDLLAIFHLKDKRVPLLNNKEKPVKDIDGIHEDVVHIPPGPKGVKAICFWPYFEKGWQLDFIGEIWDDRFGENLLKSSINEAGIYAGLLDGRPDWGRFILKEFKRL